MFHPLKQPLPHMASADLLEFLNSQLRLLATAKGRPHDLPLYFAAALLGVAMTERALRAELAYIWRIENRTGRIFLRRNWGDLPDDLTRLEPTYS